MIDPCGVVGELLVWGHSMDVGARRWRRSAVVANPGKLLVGGLAEPGPVRRQERRQSAAGQFGQRLSLLFYIGVIILIALGLTVLVLAQQRRWQGNGLRAILVVQEIADPVRRPFSVVTIDSRDNKVALAAVPPAARLPAALTYGSYTADALVGLTQLETLRWDFLRLSIGLEYGVVVDDIIWTNQALPTTLNQLRGLVRRSLFQSTYTTLTYWDRLTLWRQLWRVPSYQVDTVPLADFLQSTDQTLDEGRFDRAQSRWWLDRQIRQGGLSVVIQNGSGISGYANRLSRSLALIGWEIRRVENVADRDHTELVTADRSSWTPTQRWAWSRLQTMVAPFPNRTDPELTNNLRSDIVIILGKDQSTLFRLHH